MAVFRAAPRGAAGLRPDFCRDRAWPERVSAGSLPTCFNLVFSPTTLTPISGHFARLPFCCSAMSPGCISNRGIMRRGRAFASVRGQHLVVPMLAGFAGGLWLAVHEPGGVRAGLIPSVRLPRSQSRQCHRASGARRDSARDGPSRSRIGTMPSQLPPSTIWCCGCLLAGMMTALGGSASGHGRSAAHPVRHAGISVSHGSLTCAPICTAWRRVSLRNGDISERAIAALCGIALGSAIATELIGLIIFSAPLLLGR